MSGNKETAKMDLLTGSLLDKIILYALPLAASSVLQQLFNSADMAVVGKFAGKESLAAVGSNSSVINLIITLFVGLSVGTNVVIANHIGQKSRDGIKRAVSTAAALALASGLILTAAGMVLARPILELIDTPADVIDLSTLYLRLYFAGMPFIMIYDFGAAILRGMGDTKRPLYCLIASGLLNVILNVIMVAGLGMGVAGVGIATTIANLANAIMVTRILMHERNPFRLVPRRIKAHEKELKKMMKMGIPAGLQGMVFAVANVTIQSSINSFGSEAVAGSAAALNYEHICYFLIAAFANAAVTFMGQNYSAGNKERCRRIFLHCMWLGIVFCGSFNMLFTWQEEFFIGLFNSQPSVHTFAYIRMEWVLMLQFIACSYEISSGALRGLGHSTLPAMLTVVGTCVLRLWWVWAVVPSHHQFDWLMSIYPISWVVTGCLVLSAYYVKARGKGIYA